MLDKGLSLIIEKLNPVLVYVFGSSRPLLHPGTS